VNQLRDHYREWRQDFAATRAGTTSVATPTGMAYEHGLDLSRAAAASKRGPRAASRWPE
jgi:hypothetical protein